MRWKLIGAVAVLVLAGAALAVTLSQRQNVVEVDQASVQLKDLRPTILASGVLAFRQEVQLSSEVIGKVAEILVKEGDQVKQGDVLLRLDPSSYRAEVAAQEANVRSTEVSIDRAKINLANKRQNLERNRRLVADKFIDASRFDESRYAVDLAEVELRASHQALQQAEAQLAQSRNRLAKTVVNAPLSGTVTAVQIKVGETAVASATSIAGSSLLTIADVSSMNVEVSVDESDIARVAEGQAVRIFPAALGNQPVTGKVARVAMAPRAAGPGAASQARSYNVRVTLDTVAPALRTGMSTRVEIITSQSIPRPAVPLQAVQAAGEHDRTMRKNGYYVFAVAGGKVVRKEVQVGVADDVNQEIVSGLALGDTVVTGPSRQIRSLKEGDVVKRRADTAKQAKAGGA